MTWAEEVAEALASASWRRGWTKERHYETLRKVEGMRDAAGLVTFTRKAFNYAEGQTVDSARHKGLLFCVRNRGRHGNEYRLFTPTERDMAAACCRWCGDWVLKHNLSLPDAMAVWLATMQGWDDETGLFVCRCCDEQRVSTGCPGCGRDDTPCKINGRSVCPDCFLVAMAPDARRALVEGMTATVDLSSYAEKYVGSIV